MLPDLLDRVLAPWRSLADLRHLVRQHSRRLNTLEEQMTAFDDQLTRGAQIVALLRAEFASLRSQVADLAGQVAADEADDQAQVDAARQADADRVGGLIDQLADVLGSDTGVPVPDPGQPATDPGTGESSDDVLAGDAGSGDSSADTEGS